MDKFKKKIGVLGGGQLGLMLAQAASPLNIDITVLDPSKDAPAKRCANLMVGDFRDSEHVQRLVADVDVLTYEIEHVNVDAIKKAQNGKVSVQPTPDTLSIIQDKYKQKEYLQSFGIALPEFRSVSSAEDIEQVATKAFGYPLMLKTKTMAYDGRGNMVIRAKDEINGAIEKLGGISTGNLYVEKWVPFQKELAVMVAKGLDGQVVTYPVVETIQKDNICQLVIAPARVSNCDDAKALAKEAISKFEGAGIYGVEMFLLKDGAVLINEIAPRPHNSGHYTIEACYTSQFEQHLRCILGLPLGNTEMKTGAAIMLNILGNNESMADTFKICAEAMNVENATVHWYGKSECRKGRKMGHITLIADSMVEAFASLNKLLPVDSNPFKPQPMVGVIMGSDSDLPTMKACAQTLKEFQVPFEVTIVSAHRTPDRLMDYCRNAHKRGIKVIIAAAGGAAHLPGMAAAITPLPVIGVPVALKHLDGVDSLHSIVQMPRGVPVACVAINNSTNAALLAIRMLGIEIKSLVPRMIAYQEHMKTAVLDKVENLERIGWETYGQ